MSRSEFHKDIRFASHHFAIVPSDTVDMPVVTGVYVSIAGTVQLVDESGVSLQYTVVPGDVLPVKARRINATGTSSTGLIGFY